MGIVGWQAGEDRGNKSTQKEGRQNQGIDLPPMAKKHTDRDAPRGSTVSYFSHACSKEVRRYLCPSIFSFTMPRSKPLGVCDTQRSISLLTEITGDTDSAMLHVHGRYRILPVHENSLPVPRNPYRMLLVVRITLFETRKLSRICND